MTDTTDPKQEPAEGWYLCRARKQELKVKAETPEQAADLMRAYLKMTGTVQVFVAQLKRVAVPKRGEVYLRSEGYQQLPDGEQQIKYAFGARH